MSWLLGKGDAATMDWAVREGSFVSLAETVRHDALSWDTVEVPPLPEGEEAGSLRWSLIDSAPTSPMQEGQANWSNQHVWLQPSTPPTRPSIAAPLPVEVEESEMEPIQSLKDKLQAVRNARHALLATSPRHAQTAAQTLPTHSSPTSTSRRPKDICEESVEVSVEDSWEAALRSAWWQQPHLVAAGPVPPVGGPVQRSPDNTPKNAESVGDHRRSAGGSCMMAMATPAPPSCTSPARAPAFKAALTPLPPEMQTPCLFAPPVVPAARGNLYCRQAGRHGWAEAPVCSSVRGIKEDSSPVDPRVVGDRRALPPRLTPLDARHQCPALFLSHQVAGPLCYDV